MVVLHWENSHQDRLDLLFENNDDNIRQLSTLFPFFLSEGGRQLYRPFRSSPIAVNWTLSTLLMLLMAIPDHDDMLNIQDVWQKYLEKESEWRKCCVNWTVLGKFPFLQVCSHTDDQFGMWLLPLGISSATFVPLFPSSVTYFYPQLFCDFLFPVTTMITQYRLFRATHTQVIIKAGGISKFLGNLAEMTAYQKGKRKERMIITNCHCHSSPPRREVLTTKQPFSVTYRQRQRTSCVHVV